MQPYNESNVTRLKDISIVREDRTRAAATPRRSGQKYLTPQGFSAIKDGIRPRPPPEPGVTLPKPDWLRAPLAVGSGYEFVRRTAREHHLATVCEEAKCPNIGECWNAGTATFMLMGTVCTRACRFCAVDTGNPRGWLDREEPRQVAESVALMRLKYVVLTSVNRDDLDDGGAAHYAACIRSIRARNPDTAVEALTPDFQGVLPDVETVVDSGPQVFAQNVETVRRLTHPVRDARAGYDQTVAVLAHAKRHRPRVLTKTSVMLGLGESDAEILTTMEELRAVGVDILTLGQYLRPTANHLPVQRYVTPEQFEQYRAWGLALGFRECVSGPLVRSSYRAEQALAGNNVGLGGAQATGAAGGAAGAPVIRWLGRVAYEPVWRAMQRFTDQRTESTPDEIWLLEHEPVFTLGMNADPAHVLDAGEIPVVRIDRGGQVTYHGPGQLVVYALIDMRRSKLTVRDLVTALEQVVIAHAADRGIRGETQRAAPGVYVGSNKLASVGLRIRRGASYHGLALNVAMDLQPFQRINPCGQADLAMTDLRALGSHDSVLQVAGAIGPLLAQMLTPSIRRTSA
ncbi:MAG TPA: lipoyl synthase [Steroidobacteraceae bacterium]